MKNQDLKILDLVNKVNHEKPIFTAGPASLI